VCAASSQALGADVVAVEDVSLQRVLPVPQRMRYWLGLVALVGLYYGAAHIGYALRFAGPVAAIVWLPVGVAIAFLYLGGLRFWPGVVVGDLLVNNYAALPVGSAVGQTCGNLLEAVVAAYLIRKLVPRGSPLASLDGLARLMLALAVGTAISASVGAVSLRLGGVISTSLIPSVWRTWWLGDLAGGIVLVPLAIAWYGAKLYLEPRRVLEGATVVAAVVGLSELAFRINGPVAYLVFPPLIWAALQFSQRGATLVVLIATGVAIWNTRQHEGPFSYLSVTNSILATQLYIGVAALSTLCLTVLVSEREAMAEQLGASRARLLAAAELERRHVERNLHDGAQQRLLALGVHLRLAAESVRRAPEEAAALFAFAESQLDLAIEELRELAQGMHPTVLRDLGLAMAMRTVAARSRVPIELVELPAERLGADVEATAYYVFSEGISNAMKHAHASSIEVRAGVRGASLHVEVADNGVGGAFEQPDGGLGGLRERVEAAGGVLNVQSPPGHGTRVRAVFPTGGVG
jgi:signal transduction histidine kinase